MSPDLPPIAFLHELADAADRETLPRFRAGIGVDNKLDRDFDPVTEADRAAEQAIRALIERRYPHHSILGEEFGRTSAGADEWIIDPIDGTRAFISGVPVWGTLIGFCRDGRAGTGIMSQPFTGERFLADADCAWWERGGESRPLSVSRTARLAEATLLTTSPRLFSGAGLERFETLEGKARLTRFSLDCYGFCLLAAGHVDLVVEPGLKPYDIAALVPIVERAGGVITTFDGGRPEGGGDIVAAATPELHAAALEILMP